MTNTAVTRRRFCGNLVAGAAIATPVLSPFNVLAASTLNLDHDPDLLQAMIKMRGSLDSELVVGWLSAKRFAVSVGRVEPLCGVLAMTISKFRQVSDELFEVVNLEVAHYTDFHSGELLTSLVMPFTDKEVKVPPYRYGPLSGRYAVRLDEKTPYVPRADTNEDEFSSAGSILMAKSIRVEDVRDGKLFMRHEEHGRVMPPDSETPSVFYKESTIWSANSSEVLDTRTRKVNSNVSYSAMTGWRPWMQMGDIPGHTSSNGFGSTVQSMTDLPEDILRYTQKLQPDVLENPDALLDAFDG